MDSPGEGEIDPFGRFVLPRRHPLPGGTLGPLRRRWHAAYALPVIRFSRGRTSLLIAVVGLVLLGASPPPSPTVRCDVGDAATCAEYVQLALALPSVQAQSVASAELVSAEPAQGTIGPLGDVQIIMHVRSGADLGLVVLRDAAGSVTSLVLIGTIGVASVPTAWLADPETYPDWYAKYGYPAWYTGPHLTLATRVSPETIAMWVVILVALACAGRLGIRAFRARRPATLT